MKTLFSSEKHAEKDGYVIVGEPLHAFIDLAITTAAPAGCEICGVLVANGRCLELIRMRNLSKRPGSFQLSLRRARKLGKAAHRIDHRLVGTFHSHPVSSAEPGASDIAGAFKGQLMLIISCWDKESKLWRIHKSKATPVPLHEIGV